MAAKPLTQIQAAAVCGLSVRRMHQHAEAGTGPERDDNGMYPPEELGRWSRRQGAKERLLEAQADIAEMEAGELAGELVRRAKVADVWGEQSAAFRARALQIPKTVAPLIVPADRVADVEAEIERHVHEALAELADA